MEMEMVGGGDWLGEVNTLVSKDEIVQGIARWCGADDDGGLWDLESVKRSCPPCAYTGTG
jgi:hypothetical protein